MTAASTPWKAGHLPGLSDTEVAWQTLRFEAIPDQPQEIAVPVLTPAQAQALAQRVRQSARAVLQALPVSALIDRIDRAVAHLLDPHDPLRQQADALLPRVTGYDAAMVRLGLTRYLQTFRAPQLHRFVSEDFSNPKVLDEFQPATKGGMVRAFGPRLLVHHWAGNVPGLPLWSLACGLLVKAGNIGKLPSAEPVFATLFARALVQVDPALADCFAIVWWKGGEAEPATTLHAQADTVLAYGGQDTVQEIRTQVPSTARFLAYGHKLGVALVGREALDTQRGPAMARLAALDVARYEQQGCYSPHVFYVERGARLSPRDFAQHLAGELAALARRHPRPALGLADAAAIAQWRHAVEWSDSGQQAASNPILLGDEASPWAVAYSDRALPLAPTAGWRCIQVVAVDTLEAAADALTAHAPYLQTAGVAVAPERLYTLSLRLAQAGMTRVCALGTMTSPEAGWHHDGGCNLRDLVRFAEIEAGAERAADRLAPYAQEDGQ
ncbi:MAG: hypothetical protein RL522_2145 [Pseudomonadota bacterium]|jgi:hypothetical protein